MTALSISAIIASYNQEAFIAESVLSVADQVDEVIVVDDSSADQTYEVVRQLGLANLRLFRNERNQGVSRTFNRAADLATSDLLLIQGGDDRSVPGRAAAHRTTLADPSVALHYSRPRVITSAGLNAPDWLAPDFFPEPSERPHLERLLFDNNYICAPSVALRRHDYSRLGGFRAGLDLLQDYDLWLRLAETGSIVEDVERLVFYRKHSANLSRDYVGVDSAKHRRLRAEQDWVRNTFVDSAEETTLDVLAGSRLRLLRAQLDLLSRGEKAAMLRLSHGDKTVKRPGVAFLIGLSNQPDAETSLDRLGLKWSDLPGLMSDADHDNMDAVDAALSAGASDVALADEDAAPHRTGSWITLAQIRRRFLRGRA